MEKKGYLYTIFPLSTVGRKLTMALTGLLLVGFLVMHLAGNLLMFLGDETYNAYSHFLIKHPLIIIAEIGLILLFLFHIVDAVILRITERESRPKDYDTKKSLGKRSLSSYTMIYSGVIILGFLIFHIVTMKFGPYYQAQNSEIEMRDLYRLVVEWFSKPWYAIIYIVSMFFLGLHLIHAFQSSLRTLGISHRKYLHFLTAVSYLLAIVLAIGFAALPIYFWLFYN